MTLMTTRHTVQGSSINGTLLLGYTINQRMASRREEGCRIYAKRGGIPLHKKSEHGGPNVQHNPRLICRKPSGMSHANYMWPQPPRQSMEDSH